jgi:hypothetical protein
MVGNPQTSQTLVILKGRDNFEFFFEGEEKKYWRVRDHPDFPGWFIVDEFEGDQYIDSFIDKYENAGVSDRQDLLKTLIREPERTLEGLFGEKFEIKEVKVEEKTDEAVDYIREICKLMPEVYNLATHPPSKEAGKKALDLLRELNDLLIAFQELLTGVRGLDFGKVDTILVHVQRTLKERR